MNRTRDERKGCKDRKDPKYRAVRFLDLSIKLQAWPTSIAEQVARLQARPTRTTAARVAALLEEQARREAKEADGHWYADDPETVSVSKIPTAAIRRTETGVPWPGDTLEILAVGDPITGSTKGRAFARFTFGWKADGWDTPDEFLDHHFENAGDGFLEGGMFIRHRGRTLEVDPDREETFESAEEMDAKIASLVAAKTHEIRWAPKGGWGMPGMRRSDWRMWGR